MRSFIEHITDAIEQVKVSYPEAILYEIYAESSHGTILHAALIDRFLVVLFLDASSHLLLLDDGNGEFGEIAWIEEPWFGKGEIDWPLPFDLRQAIEEKEKAGCPDPFQAMIIRKEGIPPNLNTCIIFLDRSRSSIYLDTITGEVWKSNNSPYLTKSENIHPKVNQGSPKLSICNTPQKTESDHPRVQRGIPQRPLIFPLDFNPETNNPETNNQKTNNPKTNPKRNNTDKHKNNTEAIRAGLSQSLSYEKENPPIATMYRFCFVLLLSNGASTYGDRG